MRAAVLLGAVEGLLVALLGVGVVLIYKAERFVNLANAQLGVLSSLLLAKLVIDAGLSWSLAVVPAVAVGVLVGGGSRRLVISRLEDASRTSLMIATLGLSQILSAVAYFEGIGPDRERLRVEGYPLPFEVLWHFDALTITARHVLIAVVVPTVLAALVVWMRTSSFGLAIRAAASNPDAARLSGVDLRRTSTAAWAIAGGLSAIGAVLAAPGQAVLELQGTGPLLLLLALGAAALAGFTSIPGAVVAGLGLGVVEGMGAYVGRGSGAGIMAVFAAILIGLFVRSILVGSADADDVSIESSDEALRIPGAMARRWYVRRRTLVVAGAAASFAVLLPFVPWLREPHRVFVLASVVVFALAALSLTMLSGWAGQVSLGQFAIVAAGAFTAARLAPREWSLLATTLVAGGIGAAFAIAVGLPASRSRGLALAVTSLGVAVVGPAWLFRQPWLTPPATSSVPPAYQPGLGRLATQRSVYFVTVAVLVVACLALARLRRSNPGRAIVAVRDNAAAAAALGLPPVRVRVATLGMSGALAAAAGVLWLAVNRNISVQVVEPNTSLLMLSAVVIGGVGSVAGAVLGTVVIFGLPSLLADPLDGVFPDTLQFQLFLSGAGVLQAQINAPGGIARGIRAVTQRLLDRRGGPVVPAEPTATTRRSPLRGAVVASPKRGSMALVVRDVRVEFGGVTAVDGVSLDVGEGEVVGVIGANGAGKTTLLDAVSGLAPATGSIVLYGREVGALPPDRRAHLGLSRGFQNALLFPALTVRETIEVALDRSYPVGRVGALVGAPWARFAERSAAAEADRVIGRFGLAAVADVPIDRLSTGTRRICDLAVQAATRPRLMILDEPTSGVAQRETEAFGPLLRELVEELGCGMLVVEHDMPFLMTVADRIYCLERGRVIASGTPEAVRQDPAVVASYLGVPGSRRSRRSRARRRGRPLAVDAARGEP